MHFDPGQLGKILQGFILQAEFSAKEQGRAFQLFPAPGVPEAAGGVGGSTVSCGVAQHLQNSSVHLLQADPSDLVFNDQDKK